MDDDVTTINRVRNGHVQPSRAIVLLGVVGAPVMVWSGRDGRTRFPVAERTRVGVSMTCCFISLTQLFAATESLSGTG